MYWAVSLMEAVPDLKAIGFVPELSLRSNRQEWWHIRSHIRQRNLIVFFVHDLDCTYCCGLLTAFADQYRDWRGIRTEIVAVASNSQAELEEFAQDMEIPYPLLSDPDGTARRAFSFEQLGELTGSYIFAVDRFATLFFHDLDDTGDPLKEERNIFGEIEFLESQCPECGVYDGRWPKKSA